MEAHLRLRVTVEGEPRDLHPVVSDEIAMIGEEAIANAHQHSGGAHLEISIAFRSREFRVQFRDDGGGIDPATLASGGRHGHYGLKGMRERADRIRGKLAILSRPGGGTEISLTVPASLAYAAGAKRRGGAFGRRALAFEDV